MVMSRIRLAEKQLYWKETPTQVFSREYYKILRTPTLKNICR